MKNIVFCLLLILPLSGCAYMHDHMASDRTVNGKDGRKPRIGIASNIMGYENIVSASCNKDRAYECIPIEYDKVSSIVKLHGDMIKSGDIKNAERLSLNSQLIKNEDLDAILLLNIRAYVPNLATVITDLAITTAAAASGLSVSPIGSIPRVEAYQAFILEDGRIIYRRFDHFVHWAGAKNNFSTPQDRKNLADYLINEMNERAKFVANRPAL